MCLSSRFDESAPGLVSSRPLRSILTFLAYFGVVLLPLCAGADIAEHVDGQGVVSLTSRASRSRSVAGSSNAERARVVASDNHYDAYVSQAAALYQIPEDLVRAVIMVESGYNPRAVSKADARGLMQLVPSTASRMLVDDVFDPRQNIFGGVRYLRVLANLFNGDLFLTLAAYNAGEGAVAKFGGIPPYPETQSYVARVVAFYRQYQAQK
jgi:soluble lytic murein transglycosylase-like protein